MSTSEIINEIHHNHCEFEVLKYLENWQRNKLIEYKNQAKEARASLRAIKKINNGKNEAIDGLCEYD